MILTTLGKYYCPDLIEQETDSAILCRAALEMEPGLESGSCDVFLLTPGSSILDRKGQAYLSDLATEPYKADHCHLIRNMEPNAFLALILRSRGWPWSTS